MFNYPPSLKVFLCSYVNISTFIFQCSNIFLILFLGYINPVQSLCTIIRKNTLQINLILSVWLL